MATPDDDLIELAGEILDGTPVNWDATRTNRKLDSTILDQLQLLSHLADVHRPQPIPTDPAHPALAGVDTSSLPRWGHLLLFERVGRGSFGDVYRAWDTRLEREVALKLTDAASPVLGIEEGRLLARVRHPNVVAVYGAERLGSHIGIWTEFIRGKTLEQLLSEGPFLAADATAIGAELCSALSAVHDAGLLHRDIKAQNVMREDGGRIVLMDFGAGTDRAIEQGVDRGTFAGTPLYVAPELLAGGHPTPQSDIYSVGVLLFHLVTASFPVSGGSLDEIADGHRTGRRAKLADARPNLPSRFIAIVERAIDAAPARRFATVAAFRESLSAIAVDQPVSAQAPPRAVWLFGAAAAVASVVVAITVGPRGLSLGAGRPAALSAPANAVSMTMRKVATPPMGMMLAGTPSFDSGLYSNTDLNEDLQVFDLASGEARRLTDKGTADEYAEFSAIRPDGREVVYSWWIAADNATELRIVNIDRPVPRVLVPRRRAVEIRPVEWSRDGSAVLCLVHQPGSRYQIGLVSVATGNLRIVTDLGTNHPQHVTLSPDQRFVAWDAPAGESATQHDIFIQSVDDSTPYAIITNPSDDVSPIWTPDGQHLLFLSNRSSTYDGWIVKLENGAAAGQPTLVVPNLGQVTMAGFTSAGALYYWRRSGDMDVFTRDIDAGVGGQAERVPSSVEGANSAPAWSPDGRFLAYVSRRGINGTASHAVIVIHPVRGGTDREIPLALKTVAPTVIQWSPDGSEILLFGSDSSYRGSFVLQADTEAVTPAVVVPEESSTEGRGGMHWWTDGRSLVYFSPRTDGRIVVRERGSSKERIIFDAAQESHPLELENFEISPDGRSLAIAARRPGTVPISVLLTAPIGGTSSELIRASPPDALALQAWTPDGRALIVTKRNTRERAPHELWRVALDGTAQDTGIRIPGFTHINRIQLDPSGTRIAYTADQVSWELWSMEHFLPGVVR